MPHLSVVLPCRNEATSIAYCISQIQEVFKKSGIDGEIIVSDSSHDASPQIAKKMGATVVKHDKKGYGIACLEGFKKARGTYIIMADCDATYDFRNIPRFLAKLTEGYDIVIGNRFAGKIAPQAMPWLHQHVGNPLLSFILRIMFKTNIQDAHCGMRGFTRRALQRMQLRTTGMEFASEMMIKAVVNKMQIAQLPIHYHIRKGTSTLNSFSDGWRHLRFMLMYSPDWLFFFPGMILFMLGVFIMLLFMQGPLLLGGITLYTRPMLLGCFLTIIGYQLVLFTIYTKTYLKSIGWIHDSALIASIAHYVTFERGIIAGLLVLITSIGIVSGIVFRWIQGGFTGIEDNLLLLVFTIMILAVQTIMSVFYLSIMLVEKKN